MKGGYKRKWGALLLAGALALGLAGCQGAPASSQVSESPSPSPGEEPLVLENDGQATQIVLGELFYSEERTQALEEIAAKYMADHPETQVEVRTVQTREEMEGLVASGELGICEVFWEDQPAYVEQGFLVDIDKYVDIWDDVTGLTPAARQVIRSMGPEVAYILPAVLDQDVLYYRSDWFEAYNEDKEDPDDMVYCRSWADLVLAAEQLADKGDCLVFGGKDKLLQVFDSVVWSALSLSPSAHNSVAYLCDSDQRDTIFALDAAGKAAEQFKEALSAAVPQESLEWTEDQAVEAFIQGDAAVLLAGQNQCRRIFSAMEEGAVEMAPYPRGLMGIGIPYQEYTGFAVTSAAENEGNAADFLFYLSDPDNNTHIAQVCSLPPLHKKAAELEPSLTETLSANLRMDTRSDVYTYGQEPVMYGAWEPFQSLGDQALREYLSGELSTQALLDQFDSYWSKALQEEGKLWKTEEEDT